MVIPARKFNKANKADKTDKAGKMMTSENFINERWSSKTFCDLNIENKVFHKNGLNYFSVLEKICNGNYPSLIYLINGNYLENFLSYISYVRTLNQGKIDETAF